MQKIFCLLITLFLCFQPSIEAKSYKKPDKYQYQIAACLMFQNETFFLKEWIEYHKMLGIEHFYLFNNASTDNYMEILEPYIISGEVELYEYPTVGKNQAEHNNIQCREIYRHALKLARGKVKWLAIIDADEFIVPVEKKSLLNLLDRYEKYGGLYLNYLFFGTSDLDEIPASKLIIEALDHCAKRPKPFGKSIVRPERVSHCTDPHRMWYRAPYFHVDTKYRTFDWTPPGTADDVLLLHHYYTGDRNHAMNVKFPRRNNWYDLDVESYLMKLKWTNARFNPFMQRFAAKLRKNMTEPYRP